MPYININKAKIYYEIHGEGEPIVLIAGLKADHTVWVPILNQLAKSYQVLIFDNRGTGRTVDELESFSLETLAEDVIFLINQLNVNKPHIVGHSMGGAIAQIIARKFPDSIRSIALCNTFLKFNEQAKKAFKDVLGLHKLGASQADIMNSLLPWAFSAKFLNSEIISVVRKSREENPYPQSAIGYERQLHALCEFDSRFWINQITIPTLVLGSDEDVTATIAESKAIANKIDNSVFANIPNWAC